MRSIIIFVICISFGAPAFAVESDRREFLKGLLSTSLLAIGMGSGSAGAKVLDMLTSSKNVKVEEGGTSYTYSQTAVEQHLMLIGELITTRLLEAMFGETSFGNAHLTKEKINEMLKDPARLWAMATVISPSIEEVLFRLLPGNLFGTNWFVGTVSTLVFADSHNWGSEARKVPVPQLIQGIWFWYLLKHRGFSHSLVAHALNNNTVAVVKIIEALTSKSKTSCEIALDP